MFNIITKYTYWVFLNFVRKCASMKRQASTEATGRMRRPISAAICQWRSYVRTGWLGHPKTILGICSSKICKAVSIIIFENVMYVLQNYSTRCGILTNRPFLINTLTQSGRGNKPRTKTAKRKIFLLLSIWKSVEFPPRIFRRNFLIISLFWCKRRIL